MNQPGEKQPVKEQSLVLHLFLSILISFLCTVSCVEKSQSHLRLQSQLIIHLTELPGQKRVCHV